MTDAKLTEEETKAGVKVLATSTVGFVKMHVAVLGAVACFIIGFVAGCLV